MLYTHFNYDCNSSTFLRQHIINIKPLLIKIPNLIHRNPMILTIKNKAGDLTDPDLLCNEGEMIAIASGFMNSPEERSVEMSEISNKKLLVGVYPNPFDLDFYLKVESDSNKELTLIINNATGIQIKTLNFHILKGRNTIHVNDVSIQASGLYYLTVVENEDKSRISLPIIKQ